MDDCCIVSFMKMAIRLVNEESEICNKLVALAIKRLLSVVSDSKLNDLYLASRDWLESKNVSFRNKNFSEFFCLVLLRFQMILQKIIFLNIC